MPGRQKDSSNPAAVVWAPRLLLMAAVVNAVLFIFWHPLDWQQPETTRLRFYGLQAGLKDGPVDGRIRTVDFLKPFVNRAQGGEYESRYPSVLLDGLMAKFHQPLYSFFGPFLKEPTNIVLLLITGGFIFAAVKNFFSSRAAMLSVSAWFFSSQVLLDFCYPVRPNMILAALMFAVVFWRMSVFPGVKPSWSQVGFLVVVFLAGFHSHEITVFLLPLCALIVLSRRASYRGWGKKLLIGAFVAAGCAFFNMFVLVPRLVRTVTGASPPWTWMNDSLTGVLFNVENLTARLRDFAWVGTVHLLRQEGGMSLLLPAWARIIGGCAVAGTIFLSGWRGIKASWAFWAGGGLLLLGTTVFLFPTVPAAVETEAYYYAPIVVVFAVALGGLSAPVCSCPGSGRCTSLVGLIAFLGVLNTANSHRVMEDFPYWFGFRGPAQQYVRDILDLDDIISNSGAGTPAYLAYPRPRRFDISTKWDIMLRTWNVDPPQVFAMMLPVLQLREFEKMKFLGDPRSFGALDGVPEGEYEQRALSFCDLPRRGWIDLERLRQRMSIAPVMPEFQDSTTGRTIGGRCLPGLLGVVPRYRLPEGNWVFSFEPSPAGTDMLGIVAVRADLQPRGSEEVFFRENPMPLRVLEMSVTGSSGAVVFKHDYGWSFQLYRFPVETGRTVTLHLRNEGECEVLGPIFLDRNDWIFRSWASTASLRP